MNLQSQKNSGFTMVELLVVLAVMSLVAMIIFPLYRQLSPNIRLNSTTKDIASDLRYAQQLAVTQQVVYAVSFDVGANSYELINMNTSSTIKSITLDSQISIDSVTGLSATTAQFNVTGAAVESGIITLINLSNTTSTIEIKPSGYVKITD